MGSHLTARLAWHEDGWNGHVCSDPGKNTYCVGGHSYPGDMIAEQRDLTWEQSCAGRDCSTLDKVPPCIYSLNAFGGKTLKAFAKPPEFFNKESKRRDWVLPPATVCIWPYEEMYRTEVRDGPRYDARERKKFADEFFSKIEKGRSLVFYYANYSNPFSSDELPRYALVGLSRVADVGSDLYYDGCDERTLERYGGYVWDRNITSAYPEQGLRLPYHLYKDDSRIDRFAIFPDNPLLCKYGSKLVTDDEALGLVEQFHESVQALIDLGDTSENWAVRRGWLEGVISELWQRRGAYPGMAEVCIYLRLHEAVPYLKNEVALGREVKAVEAIWKLLDGKTQALGTKNLTKSAVDAARRSWKLLESDLQQLLKNVLPRLDIDADTITRIIEGPHLAHGLYAKAADIASNPYLLPEQFIGVDADDRITWGKLDRAAIPSPELGVPELVAHDSAQRLRALAVECLSRVSGHTFLEENDLVALMNKRLQSVPPWKQIQFRSKYFEVDEPDYSGALFFRDEDEGRYVYLRHLQQSEQRVEREIKQLIQRADIALKVPMTDANWRDFLFIPDSPLALRARKEYEAAIATQVAACARLFRRGFSVLCGAAGTGKTTVLASIVKAIRKVDGIGAAVIALAPTGKAANRAREILQRDPLLGGAVETSTIHSFLAKRGWLNKNLTFARYGGEQETERQTIIIDECSMIDLELFATLFLAIKWSTVKRLILIGDPNQLPPIGTGRVFADIVHYCRRESPGSICELTANLRQLESRAQGKGTGIVELASLYRQAELSDEKDEDRDAATEELFRRVQSSGDVDQDLRVLYWQESAELGALLLQRMTADMGDDAKVDPGSMAFYELWDKAFQRRPEYAQVLSPYRGELYGIEALNLAIQHHKSGDLIKKRGTLDGIALFDKVIQRRNRTASDPIYGYDSRTKRVDQHDVFNGELGFVGPHGYDSTSWKSWNFRLQRFAVTFSNRADIRINYGSDLGKDARGKFLPNQRVEENLELGYAISVHKAQGSEFDRIYVVIPASKRQLLSQELLYTALTRGKKHCTLLVQRDAGVLIDMRRRERCWLNRINSSLLGWHLAPPQLLKLEGWYEAGKIHEALSRDMVRSKSEVIIANILHERNITFYYEKPLFAPDGTMYLPDFTLVWQGEEIYWEHVGRLSDPEYARKWAEKLAWYNVHFPGQLKITYERNPGLAPGAPAAPLDVSIQADQILKQL